MAYDRKRSHDLTSLRAEKDKSKLEQTFEIRITSAFTTMRENIERTARETNAYADKMSDLLSQLEGLHLHKHAGFQTTQGYMSMNKEKFDDLLSTYSYLLDELAPRRKQVVDAGEESTQVQSAQMRMTRKGIMNAAKRRLDEGREKQQLAIDASELMKHYKALIMAT